MITRQSILRGLPLKVPCLRQLFWRCRTYLHAGRPDPSQMFLPFFGSGVTDTTNMSTNSYFYYLHLSPIEANPVQNNKTSSILLYTISYTLPFNLAST